MINETMTNEEYHADKRICSSLLKQALISQAHIEQYLTAKRKPTDAMLVGTAVHSYFLERSKFDTEYKEDIEKYAKKFGTHEAGDPKLDDNGNPIISLILPTGEVIKGENYKKFKGMCVALDNCKEAQDLLIGGKTEVSIFTETERVRPDLITADGYIVDLKTVGGLNDMALDPDEFAKTFWSFGYDLQMYMYWKLCKEEGLEVKGFKFVCVDGKEPCGVRIFQFNENSDWYKIGQQRYELAWANLSKYYLDEKHTKYEQVVIDDLPVFAWMHL